MAPLVTDVKAWLEQNERFFKPPACVKHLHESQLKVFFVGGPNRRSDFHIEAGEEFFYMLKGEMCLTVLEKDTFRDIIIKEGEIFLLPGKIPHSPQRKPDTIGMVVERRRQETEMDCLRYFVSGTKDVLYETWFNWETNSSKLGEYIEEFYRSEEYWTGVPKQGSVAEKSPIKVDHQRELGTARDLKGYIEINRRVLRENGSRLNIFEEGFKSQIQLLGAGKHSGRSPDLETYLLQLEGGSEMMAEDSQIRLDLLTSALISAGESWELENEEGGVTLKVVQSL